MARHENSVRISGRISRIWRYGEVGEKKTPMLSFSLSVGRKYRNRWENFFLPCTAWGNAARTLHEEYRESDDVLLTQAILTRDSWKDKATGQLKRQIKVVVFGVERFQRDAPQEPKPPKEDPGIPPELVQDTAGGKPF